VRYLDLGIPVFEFSQIFDPEENYDVVICVPVVDLGVMSVAA
jgi:hypothetical protein